MIRTYLCEGDKAGGAVIIEGLDTSTYQDDTTGRYLRMATANMRTYCSACKKVGFVCLVGPRLSDIAENGEESALSGDINICDCIPAPVFFAQRNMTMDINSEDVFGTPGAVAGAAVGSVAASSLLNQMSENDDLNGNAAPATAPDAKANNDCSYLNGSKRRIDAPADFYKHTNTVTVGPGKQTDFDFPGGGLGGATEYDATVNGKIIPIYISSQAPPKGAALTGYKELAKALEVLPPKHLENIGKISANPIANPDDAYWMEKYGKEDFTSAATADVKQGVAFFPWRKWPSIPQQYIDSTMLHETGHQVSEVLWKDLKMKQSWIDAIGSDGAAPSRYAQENANEDFSESANMYWSSKGTRCEAEGRQRYPARYAYFDKISQ